MPFGAICFKPIARYSGTHFTRRVGPINLITVYSTSCS